MNRTFSLACALLAGLAVDAAEYSIGDPTPEEQLYVEFINRARANPPAEAQLLAATTDPAVLSQYEFWEVNLALMISQFAVYQPAQPLAINPRLTAAARRHTSDMLTNVFQGHNGSDGSTPQTRIEAEAYPWRSIGENVFAQAESVWHGHAGFEVDWGPGVAGMQNPPGHRNTIHNGSFREIGVGVLLGRNEKGADRVGPQLVTQEFATQQGDTPFITGVAYYDLNGNNFYDIGEGIGGLTVTVSGATMQGVTALSGGYAVPVAGNGAYTVTFSGGGFTPVEQNVTVAGGLNQKVDFRPAYTPPTVNGPTTPLAGRANSYTIGVVPGAAEYEWRSYEEIQARSEGAENGTNNITIDQTAGYDVIQSDVKRSGGYAFHLIHPASGPRAQTITLKPTYLPGANSRLIFLSRLGFAASDEHARVQVSIDDGATWQTVYTQPGTNAGGETTFNERSVDLSQFEGRQVRVRFNYDWNGGSFASDNRPEVGWIIDDIAFTNVQEVTNEQATPAPGGSFQFTPPVIGNYSLQARARTGHYFLDWGPTLKVRAIQAGTTLEYRIGAIRAIGNELRFTVTILSGTAPATLALESKAAVDEAWSAETSTTEIVSSTELLVKASVPGSGRRFYRLRAN